MFRISDKKVLSFYDLLYLESLIGLFRSKYIFMDNGNNILLEAKIKSNNLLLIKSALLFLFTFVIGLVLSLNIFSLGEIKDSSSIIVYTSLSIGFILAFLFTYYINTIQSFKIYIKDIEGFEEGKVHYRLYQVPGINIFKNSYKLENEYGEVICNYTKQNFLIKKLGEINYEGQNININQDITYNEVTKVTFNMLSGLIIPGIGIGSNNILMSDKITDQVIGKFVNNTTLDLAENMNYKLPVLYAIGMSLIFKKGD